MIIKDYLKLLRYSFYYLIFFISLVSCTKKNDSEYVQLKKEIKETYGVHLPPNTKYVFIVNDNYCPICVNHFSQYVLTVLDENEDALCFVNSNGVNVDLESYRNKQNKNIYISNERMLKNNVLLPPNLGIIFLYGSRIDTTIYIHSDSILQQLKFINSKIFSNEAKINDTLRE